MRVTRVRQFNISSSSFFSPQFLSLLFQEFLREKRDGFRNIFLTHKLGPGTEKGTCPKARHGNSGLEAAKEIDLFLFYFFTIKGRDRRSAPVVLVSYACWHLRFVVCIRRAKGQKGKGKKEKLSFTAFLSLIDSPLACSEASALMPLL